MTQTHQPVDADAVRSAKTLLRTARHGALAALAPETGAPLVSRVSLATLPDGAPV
ncbi:MAG: HugZ family protein, partial [Pseudomonadota bacterium]